MPLKPLGFWRKENEDCGESIVSSPTPFLEWPTRQVPKYSAPLTAVLLRYITLYSFIESWELGYSFCRHACAEAKENVIEMGCTTLTDGVWVWPEGLAHYLHRHNVKLPEDFVLHVLCTVHAAAGGTGDQVCSIQDARIEEWVRDMEALLPTRNHLKWEEGEGVTPHSQDFSRWLRSRSVWLRLDNK